MLYSVLSQCRACVFVVSMYGPDLPKKLKKWLRTPTLLDGKLEEQEKKARDSRKCANSRFSLFVHLLNLKYPKLDDI